MLESQKRENYKNEYDWRRGAMLAGLVKESSKKYIYQRRGKLKDLARESIHGKNHVIFSPKEYDEKTDEENVAEKTKKPRARHKDSQENENATRILIQHMNELQYNVAELHRISERRTRR